jgi:hypothetical protein
LVPADLFVRRLFLPAARDVEPQRIVSREAAARSRLPNGSIFAERDEYGLSLNRSRPMVLNLTNDQYCAELLT